jgi:hypothetical protein
MAPQLRQLEHVRAADFLLRRALDRLDLAADACALRKRFLAVVRHAHTPTLLGEVWDKEQFCQQRSKGAQIILPSDCPQVTARK